MWYSHKTGKAINNVTSAGPCIIIQFKQINQPDATVAQVYYLTFMCRSTCFGRLHAHHQELTTALIASGFTLERGGGSVIGRGLIGWLIYLKSIKNVSE